MTTLTTAPVARLLERLFADAANTSPSTVPSGALAVQERAFLVAVRARAEALQGAGLPAAEGGELLTAEFKANCPDWTIDDLTGFAAGIRRAPSHAATKRGQ